jgi:predicted flap endonuclease-1-like 5' DNA nuclease
MLWWILPALLGLALGYLLNTSWKRRYEEMKDHHDQLLLSNNQLKSENRSIKQEQTKANLKIKESDRRIDRLIGQKNHLQTALAKADKSDTQQPKTTSNNSSIESNGSPVIDESSNQSEANEVFNLKTSEEKKSKKKSKSTKKKSKDISEINNNLQVIEGIGPKMESVLKENGIETWAKLADKSKGDLKKMLEKYGSKYALINVTDWPTQAQFASQGKWEELIKFQQSNNKTLGSTKSKAKAMLSKYGLIQPPTNQSDLTIFEGIGSRIATILGQNDIKNWEDLANTPVVKLRGVLESSDPVFKMIDPSSWPKQAQLAISGKDDILKEYQEFLRTNS